MRCELEREATSRQTLQLQLENKEQLLASLKMQMEARNASQTFRGAGGMPLKTAGDVSAIGD